MEKFIAWKFSYPSWPILNVDSSPKGMGIEGSVGIEGLTRIRGDASIRLSQ